MSHDTEMSLDDIRNMVISWLDRLPEGRLSRGGNDPRTDARVLEIAILLKTFKNMGYSKDQLSMVKSVMLVSCTPEGYNGVKLKKWKSILEDRFHRAKAKIWPVNIDAKLTEEELNPTPVEIPKPEKIEKYPPNLTKEELLEILREETALTPRIGRPMDQDFLDSLPKSNIVWDEEFAEMLGLKIK